MSITVGRLELAQPLLNGSGTWDAEQAHRIFGEANPGLAGFVTKTITPEPRAGNPAPRIAPSRQGLLNSIGLPGPGREAFLTTLLPHLRTIVSGPIICSVGGFSLADYVDTVAALESDPACGAIELNVSCPNVESGCASIGGDAGETERLTTAARQVTTKPLFVKLSASVADCRHTCRISATCTTGKPRSHRHGCRPVPLQVRHAVMQFIPVSRPPRDTGTMCSRVSSSKWKQPPQ